ncbi:MAG: hypothetical protein LBG30_05360 [Odoribacteraceae bacterium]|nr:hypothetical protein [Odoribacteraceae bacterium]
MNHYLLPRPLARLLARRGHGIHSPFVFDLVTNLLRQRATYYAFLDLPPVPPRERALCHLLFRLADRYDYRRVLLVGDSVEHPSRYLLALSSRALLLDDALSSPPWQLFHAGPLLHLPSPSDLDRWLSLRAAPSCAVISSLRTHPANRLLWRHFLPVSRVSINASRHGLLFFDPRLQPGHYFI